ncbi:MAG: hypothetical protein WBS20_16990 [Lysobacterales bacterium]
MKYFFCLLVLFCASYGSDLSATPVFVYNHGYVLGELNRVEIIGPTRKIIAGEVSIGNNSFSGENDFRDDFRGDYVLNNPWSFCGDQKIYGKLAAYMGEFAVIEYKTPKKSSLLQCQSTNEIIGIYPVSRGNPSSPVRESTKIVMAGKPYGVSVGRIDNAPKSDRHGKNWSVVIQVGNSGNDFRYLQIIDADLYAFALDCLFSATKVKVYHVERIGGLTRPDSSDAYVWRIEAKPGL